MNRILIFSATLLTVFQAHAYNLYETKHGNLVRWNASEVEILLDSSLAELGDRDRVESVIKQGFRLWTDSADVPVEFVFKREDCAASVNERDNCITACANTKKCYRDKEEKGATTYLHVIPSSGEIRGADIVFNAADWEWDTESTRADSLNLARVTAHEVGHFVGIDHSEEPSAVMYWSMSKHDNATPVLHQDDMLAAENLYDGFTVGDVDTADCSVTAVGSDPANARSLVYLFLMGILIGLRRLARKESR